MSHANANTPGASHEQPQEPTPPDSMSGRPRPPPARRRDKPQLSCNACRRRKVRCDRLHPCNNCSSRGQGSSCTYSGGGVNATASRPSGPGHVQDRINQLENLVLTLMQQNASSGSPDNGNTTCTNNSAAPLGAHASTQGSSSSSEQTAEAPPSRPRAQQQQQRGVSPSPSDYGTISFRESGTTSYVSSAHWAAVLDNIAELKQHFAQEDDAEEDHLALDPVEPQTKFPGPQLLYSTCSMPASRASILEAIPPRPIVDRLVSCYFNSLDLAPGIIHSIKFLREYEEFWKAPQDAPIVWVGLLLAMICVSAQFRNAFLMPDHSGPLTPESHVAVDTLREKAIQCLTLGHYIKGGPYVLETLIMYLLVELFFVKGVDNGIWVLSGTIVQVAIHMGYHWDPAHFPNLSPFAGEMRRRVWALVRHIDYSASTQIGLPRLVRESQSDTAPPRNLFDADLTEDAMTLPPARPETEVTPLLYVVAKLRLLPVGTRIADLATAPRPHAYAEILELDRQIEAARAALPPDLRWAPLAASLSTPAATLLERIWLEVSAQRLKVDLHRKFLEPARRQRGHKRSCYAYSRATCLAAAARILEFQHLLDEETRVDGRLYQSRRRLSSAYIHDFLLATSILCFYLQMHKEEAGEGQNDKQEQEQEGVPGNEEDEDETTAVPAAPELISVDQLKFLLRRSQVIWNRTSVASKEARKAAAALRYVLGDTDATTAGSDSSGLAGLTPGPTPAPYSHFFSGFPDTMPVDGFPGLQFDSTNGTPVWQQFHLNFNNDIEQWPGLNSFSALDPSL